MFEFQRSVYLSFNWLVMNHIYLIYILSGRYLLEEKADDSILLTLVIHIMDALVNYGNGHCIWMN